MSHTSQRDRILRRLIEARGDEVTAPELARIGGLQFQTRIYELRHEFHFQIENRTERVEGGQVHSFYRLVSAPLPITEHKDSRAIEDSLFPNQPERHRDDG
jgi:hypothetical protein